MSYRYDRRTAAASPTPDVNRLERLSSGIKAEAGQLAAAFDKYKKDPGRMAPQLDNMVKSAIEIESMIRTFYRTLGPEFTGKL